MSRLVATTILRRIYISWSGLEYDSKPFGLWRILHVRPGCAVHRSTVDPTSTGKEKKPFPGFSAHSNCPSVLKHQARVFRGQSFRRFRFYRTSTAMRINFLRFLRYNRSSVLDTRNISAIPPTTTATCCCRRVCVARVCMFAT